LKNFTFLESAGVELQRLKQLTGKNMTAVLVDLILVNAVYDKSQIYAIHGHWPPTRL
jgi:hypothetical protein